MQYIRTAYSVLLRKALRNVASNTKHRSQAFRNFQICYLMGGKKHKKQSVGLKFVPCLALLLTLSKTGRTNLYAKD